MEERGRHCLKWAAPRGSRLRAGSGIETVSGPGEDLSEDNREEIGCMVLDFGERLRLKLRM